MYKGFIKIETPRGSAFGETCRMYRTCFTIPLLPMRVRRAQVNSQVATLNCQGSQTGQEVSFDLFFYVNPFQNLAGVEQNLNGSSKFTVKDKLSTPGDFK